MTGLNSTDLSVLTAIEEHATNRVMVTTYRNLAALAGCARSTVHRSLARLQEAELIRVDLAATGLKITRVGGGR